MKVLVEFALNRRFVNRTAIILNILTFVIAGCVFFADKIIYFFDEDFAAPLTIYLDAELYQHEDEFTEMKELYTIKEDHKKELSDNEVLLKKTDQGYEVVSLYGVNEIDLSKIRVLIDSYEEVKYSQTHDINEVLEWEMIHSPEITQRTLNKTDALSADRQTLAFFILTGVYFTTLSFCGSMAQEVVYEKTSRILELILTSVQAKTHFYAKMLSGWLAIIIQSLISGLSILFWYFVRLGYDSGRGLLKIAHSLGLLQAEANTFKELMRVLDLDTHLLSVLLCLFIFLLLGILFIQMVMAILSSYVTSIEESGTIQAPCYILLLIVYYLAISLNRPYPMSVGLGKWLSYLPFFSMLFMPCRMMLGVVSWYEVLLSMVLSFAAILIVLDFGAPYYEKGILDTTIHKTKKIQIKLNLSFLKNKNKTI